MINNIKNGTEYCPAMEAYIRKNWPTKLFTERNFEATREEYFDCIDNYSGRLTKVNDSDDRYDMVEWRDDSMPEFYNPVAERCINRKTGEANYRIISNYKEIYNTLFTLKDSCPCCHEKTRGEILQEYCKHKTI